MRCKNCGAELEPGSAFCTNCGAPVTNETCPNCGEPLEDNSAFCTHCGAKVGKSEPPTWNERPRQQQMPNREKGKGRGVLIGILSGVIVLLLAAAAAIVLNVTGVIDLNGIFNGGQPRLPKRRLPRRSRRITAQVRHIPQNPPQYPQHLPCPHRTGSTHTEL